MFARPPRRDSAMTSISRHSKKAPSQNFNPMKASGLLFGFCILAAALLAVEPYPCVLTAEYKNQRLPVVHVHDMDPVVSVNGKEKEIWQEPYYIVKKADGFADNFVASPPGTLAGHFQTKVIGDPNEYGPRSFSTDIKFELTAQKTIKRGFAIVVIFSDTPRNSGFVVPAFYGGPTIIVHDLPKLPAGKAVKVKFTANGEISPGSTLFFAQIFDDAGQEVRTTDSEFAWAFYAWRGGH